MRVAPRLARKALADALDSIHAVWPEVIAALDLPTESHARTRDTEGRAHRCPEALLGCMRIVSAHCEVVIAVDDVDRADMESVAFLLSLARASRSQRLVVLTTAGEKATQDLSPALRALARCRLVHPVTRARSRRRRRAGQERVRRRAARAAHGDAALHLDGRQSGPHDACPAAPGRRRDVRYVAGAWSLPLELPKEKLEQSDGAPENLGRCSAESRRLAALLAIRDEPAPLEWSVAFEAETTPVGCDRRARRALDVRGAGREGRRGTGSRAPANARRRYAISTPPRPPALRCASEKTLLASSVEPALRMKASMHLIARRRTTAAART